MKTALGIVIYKQSKDFFTDLMASVENQTDSDFELLIINDNYSASELEEIGFDFKKASLKRNADGDFTEAEFPIGSLDFVKEKVTLVNEEYKKLSIGMLRVELLLEAKNRGYEMLVIADADDTFVQTRIENHKKAYKLDKKATFYYNKLVKENGDNVFDFIPNRVESVKAISQSNFLGMSTTSINLGKLSEDYIESLKKGDCNIFDWYLYSRLLLDMGYGVLVEDAATIYRIHDANEVGVTVDIERERAVKLAHYKRLADEGYDYFKYLAESLKACDLNKIDTSVAHHGYWWSNILMEDSYEI